MADFGLVSIIDIRPYSALDHLANASYQITIESTSYREKLSPHRRKEVLTTISTK